MEMMDEAERKDPSIGLDPRSYPYHSPCNLYYPPTILP
jgi:hypothetical protein